MQRAKGRSRPRLSAALAGTKSCFSPRAGVTTVGRDPAPKSDCGYGPLRAIQDVQGSILPASFTHPLLDECHFLSAGRSTRSIFVLISTFVALSSARCCISSHGL